MTDIRTGTDVLRDALRARRRKGHLGLLARDLQIGVAELERYCDSDNWRPPVDIMNGLAKDLLGTNVRFDEAANLLVRAAVDGAAVAAAAVCTHRAAAAATRVATLPGQRAGAGQTAPARMGGDAKGLSHVVY